MAEQNIIEFLSHLRKLDVRVWADDKQLRASAPDGVLTPELRAQLSARKAEILAFLQQANQASQNTQAIQKTTREGLIPLSFSQQRIWFFDQLQPQNPAYNIPASVRLIGPLNMSAVQASINEIVQRHEVLRTSFGSMNDQPFQRIAPSLSLPMPVIDLRSVPIAERESTARQAVHEEAQRPFDLANGPLLRVSFLRLNDDEHVLMFTIHHVISDDWSMGVFVGELAALYPAFANRQPSPLMELPIQYADYAVWQRSEAHSQLLQSQLAFWQERLAPLAGQPPIPTDRPRQPTQTYQGERRFRMFPESLAVQLKALSQQEESTLFMVLLAGINILLRQYMGGHQIVLGSPVAGRNKREIEELIGFFVNTVVLRTDLTGDPSFHELLVRVREVTTSAYAHQDVPFEQVVESLRSQRDQNQGAPFQVFFNMLNAASQQVEIPGLKIKPFSDFIVGAPDIGAKFDLTFVAVEHPSGLQVDISYNVDLFEPETIDWLLAHLQTILENVVADPRLSLSAIPNFPTLKKDRVEPPAPFTAFSLAETEQSLPACFEKQVEQYSSQTAIAINGKTLTYDQLNRAANRLARWIQQVYAVETKEQSLSLLLGHNEQMVVGMLASLKAGKIFVASDPGYPLERLIDMLDDSEAGLIVTNNQHLPLAENLRSRVKREIKLINIDHLDTALADDNLSLPIDPGQIAYIVYTSGSTGRPKGVMQNHRNVLHFIRNYTNSLHLSAQDRLSLIPSFSFSAAMMDTFGALLNGASLYPFDVAANGLDQLGAWLIENEITVYHSVPTIFRHFVATLTDGILFPHLRLIDFGGEPVSRRDVELYRKHFSPSCLLVNGLGATELNVIRQLVMDHRTEFLGDRVPVGYAVPETRILLLDENGQEVGYNQPGEIVIESQYLSPGYWRQSEQTAAVFKTTTDGLRRYFTGDLGRLRPDGCLEHYGRKDLQVKIHGVRIEPAEIEGRLLEQVGVKEAAVIAQDNPAGEKILAAYLVATDVDAPPTVETLRTSVLATLPSYMLPSEFVFLKAMPLTSTGKIDRRALPVLDRVRPANNSYVAPRTPVEAAWAKIWQDVLKVEQVGINDNFFDLGGDSLQIMRLIAKTRQAGLAFTPRDLSRHPTIAALAALAKTPAAPQPQAEQQPKTGLLPLTIAQRWFFSQGFHAPDHWNITRLVEIPAGIGPELFEQAVRYLWTYHDGLRARFVQIETGWQQAIIPADQNTEVPFTYFDFSALPVSEHTDAIERAAQEMQESLRIVDGPLLRVGFFNLGEKRRGRLLITLHHLIYDGASTIFFDDFYTLFQQISQGKPAQLPAKTTAIWTWLERLDAYAQSTELQQEGEYWLSLPWQEVQPLPLDYPENRGTNTWSSVRSLQTRLSAEETEVLMRKIPQVYGVQVIDVLIAALANTLTTWSSQAWSLFDAIDFGRNAIPNTDDLDLSRTVGWFSVHRHLLLQGESNTQPEALLKLIRAQLQTIPNRGLGYEILLYSSKDGNVVDGLQKLPHAEVALSYDGFQYGNTNLSMAYEYPGPASNLENQRSYLLDCSVQIVDGRLVIRWGYNKNLHKQSTVKALAENYTQWLQALLAQYAAVQQGEPGNA